MKKLLIASAVSSLFATSATALAAGGPAAPTLDKVLEASGISVSGYIDAGYTHADRNLEGAGVSTRVFDSQNNSFGLNQVGLSIAKQPKEGFGGLVNFTVGKDAQVIHSLPEPTGNASSMFDVTQAYAQYASGSLTVIAGKYATLLGTEVIWSPSNANISRSLLFKFEPFTHTGVRATWALNDKISLIGGLNNGWDQVTDTNKGKSVELGVTSTPIRALTVGGSVTSGKEATAAGDGDRTSVNVTGSYAITSAISAGAEVLILQQEVPGGAKSKVNGVALYGSWLFIPTLRASLRLEPVVDDKNGTLGGPATGTKYSEVTATAAYLPAENFEVRGEVRMDRASDAVFVNTNGSTSKSLMTVAAQALYKF